MPRWTFVSFMAEWKKLPPYTAQREHLFFFIYVIFVFGSGRPRSAAAPAPWAKKAAPDKKG